MVTGQPMLVLDNPSSEETLPVIQESLWDKLAFPWLHTNYSDASEQKSKILLEHFFGFCGV